MASSRYLRLSVLRMFDAVVEAPEELGRHDVRAARPAQLGDGLAHDPLGLAARVGLRVVEEVHARVVGGGEAVARPAHVELGAEGDPRAERQHADLQAGPAEAAVGHLHGGLLAGRGRLTADTTVPPRRTLRPPGFPPPSRLCQNHPHASGGHLREPHGQHGQGGPAHRRRGGRPGRRGVRLPDHRHRAEGPGRGRHRVHRHLGRRARPVRPPPGPGRPHQGPCRSSTASASPPS